MPKQITYNLNSKRATYYQKRELLSNLLDIGCSEDVFIAWALNHLTWRQMKEIAYHMQVVKNSEEKAQAYDNRTDEETVDA